MLLLRNQRIFILKNTQVKEQTRITTGQCPSFFSPQGDALNVWDEWTLCGNL